MQKTKKTTKRAKRTVKVDPQIEFNKMMNEWLEENMDIISSKLSRSAVDGLNSDIKNKQASLEKANFFKSIKIKREIAKLRDKKEIVEAIFPNSFTPLIGRLSDLWNHWGWGEVVDED